MATVIRGGSLLAGEDVVERSALILDDERITAIAREPIDLHPGDMQIDASDCLVVPGFVDVHHHGEDGHDAMDCSPEALAAISRRLPAHGVTSWLPTTVTAPPDVLLAAIDAVRRFSPPAGGARPLGMHLEGPYLNAEHRGAQDPAYLRDPDPSEYRRWFEGGVVRLVTVAPERPGVPQFIAEGAARGVRFAAGHCGPTYEEVVAAADLGLDQATHTFNGMHALHHRAPGVIGAALTDDRIRAQIISDGKHLHPAVVALVLRAKGPQRTLLVTDAMRATGLADGVYRLGEQDITVTKGVPRTAAGGLAGSTLTMDAAVRNTCRFTGLAPASVVRAATLSPAAALGVEQKIGVLAPGARADVVVLGKDLDIRQTIIGGRVAYPAPAEGQ